MAYRSPLPLSFVLLPLVMLSNLAFSQTYHEDQAPDSRRFASPCCVGAEVVHGFKGSPAANAKVSLISLSTGMVVVTGFTGSNGTVEFDVPEGAYEIVATEGLSEVRERVNTIPGSSFCATELLRLPDTGDARKNDEDTITLSELKVPNKAWDQMRKAQSLIAKHKTPDARRELNKAIDIYPAYARAFMWLGILDLEENKPGEAAGKLEQAVTLDPSFAMSHVALANSYNSLGRFRDALHTLEQAERLGGGTWQLHFESARAELGLDDFDGALREAQSAEQLNRNPPASIYLLNARALAGKQLYSEAASAIETFLHLEPDSPDAVRLRQTVEDLRSRALNR